MGIFSSSKLMLLFLIQMCYKWGDVDHNFLWTVCSRSWYCCIGLSIDNSCSDDEGRQILKQTIGLRKKIYRIENEKKVFACKIFYQLFIIGMLECYFLIQKYLSMSSFVAMIEYYYKSTS